MLGSLHVFASLLESYTFINRMAFDILTLPLAIYPKQTINWLFAMTYLVKIMSITQFNLCMKISNGS